MTDSSLPQAVQTSTSVVCRAVPPAVTSAPGQRPMLVSATTRRAPTAVCPALSQAASTLQTPGLSTVRDPGPGEIIPALWINTGTSSTAVTSHTRLSPFYQLFI